MKEKVIKIIKETLGIGEEREITGETDISSLGVNSLNFLRIIVEIEEAFDIEFDDNELNFDYFNTIDSVIKLIESKMN
ncbi:MAG: acyl carrier protein [Clostridium sp.]|nr:acyl carrier protein [Clostridium sp.]